MIDRVVAALAGYIESAQRAGVSEPSPDARSAAPWLISMIERGLYQIIGDADDEEAECQLDALTDIIWRVVYRRSK